MPVILPEVTGEIRAMKGKRRYRGVYLHAEDLASYLYKAASEPGQAPDAASGFRMLAEELEDAGFKRL